MKLTVVYFLFELVFSAELINFEDYEPSISNLHPIETNQPNLSMPTNTPSTCTNNSHIHGTWKIRPKLDTAQKSFVCCGWDDDDFRWNTEKCGETKVNGNDLYYGRNTTVLMQTGGHACHCDIKQNHRTTISPREKYEWVPSSCSLLPFNGIQFCNLLGDRTILFIGDSTMQQTFGTIASMISATGGLCGNQLSNARTDFLYFRRDRHSTMFEYIDLIKPNICIFNAGAHMHDMGDIWDIWEHMKQPWKDMKNKYPDMKLVWKTQNPGEFSMHVLLIV